jgi:uncharacterized membrane protein YfcA
MWFYPLVLAVVILAIVGGTLAGGIFTLVLVPLAAIALVSAVVYMMWGRAIEANSGASSDATHMSRRPLPHRRRRPSGRAPSSPDALTDARRQQQ